MAKKVNETKKVDAAPEVELEEDVLEETPVEKVVTEEVANEPMEEAVVIPVEDFNFELNKSIAESLKDFDARANNSGVTYFGKTGRILKVIETKKGLKVEFNCAVSSMDGVITLTENEASEKHMGSCQWIYSGIDLNIITGLIEECILNYNSKLAKEKPKKEVKNKSESKKESKKEFIDEFADELEEKEQTFEDISKEIEESDEF